MALSISPAVQPGLLTLPDDHLYSVMGAMASYTHNDESPDLNAVKEYFQKYKNLAHSCKKLLDIALKHFGNVVIKKFHRIIASKENEWPFYARMLQWMGDPRFSKAPLDSTSPNQYLECTKDLTTLVIWFMPSTVVSTSTVISSEVLNLIPQFPNLAQLLIGKGSNIVKFTPQFFPQLAINCKNIQLIEIDYADMEAAPLLAAVKQLEKLRSLRVRGIVWREGDRLDLTSAAMKKVSFWPDPRRSSPINSKELFEELGKQSELTEIIVNHAFWENPEWLDPLVKSKSVHKFEHIGIFTTNALSDGHIEKLGNFLNLTSLHIERCEGITDACATTFCKLKKLKSLKIKYAPITDLFLARINQNLQITTLSFYACPNINDRNFASLLTIPTLNLLDLNAIPSITDQDLAVIATHPALTELYLTELSGITDIGISVLSQQLALKILYVRGCKNITSVALNNLRINHPNAGLKVHLNLN